MTRQFPTRAVLSLTTGRTYGPISEMMEVGQFLLRDPTVTLVGLALLQPLLTARILAQHPTLPHTEEPAQSDWEQYIATQEAQFGTTLTLTDD